ncbi:uncharacterized protein LOC123664238 [Melitaea cinxia]|uniref:uncharacterized protein LOC123664238 n=1 Tax=Melitaea cinxia TaxID=113334 RepID=UPI001E26F9E4|nr:uncharacterized protein LOC123664238 [Melitaea cinxia]
MLVRASAVPFNRPILCDVGGPEFSTGAPDPCESQAPGTRREEDTQSALTAISGIPPTADNYDLIYSTLVDKYQDIRTLASTYLQQIINLKPLTTASADGLNVFLDKFAASFIKEQVKIIERSSSNTFNTPPTRKNSYSKSSSHFAPKPVNKVKHTKSFITSESNNNCCPLCLKIGHEQFYRCPKFLKLTPKERYNIVKENNSCCNCLSFNHKTFLCKSNKSCSICESKTHHTLLHFHKNLTSSPASGIEPRLTAEQNPATHAPHTAESSGATNYSPAIPSSYDASHTVQPLSMCSNTLLSLRDAHTVLLATARIVLRTSDGYEYIARALIDNGSMNDFVTSNLCKKLSLKINSLPEKVTVNGFGGSSKEVKGQTNIKFYSRFDRNISFNLQPFVVENITDRIPTLPIDRSMLAYLSRTPLADDTFSDPGEVEMLIGAKLFTRLLLPGRVHGPPGTPTGIQTPLGFILMGDAPVKCRSHRTAAPPSHTLCAFTGQPLDVLMRSFWETEEVATPRSALLSHEEKVCEDLYKSSTTREATGTYVVSLPFKTNPSALGDSMQSSKSRFFALEKRFLRDPNYRSAYNNIITDYCDKDYISPISADSKLPSLTYVIPHHGVIREDKITTKIRMVLDASARTDTGVSLNDILFSGPNLQADLFIILLNFRLLPIALCADVEQMYLRIKVHPQFYKFQQILYRFNTSDPIQLFEFKRVCFGLTSSPFLALRTLRQLADDEKNNFPLASEVINGGFFFMDDICCSINDVHSAQKVASQLIDMFAAGGFKLHKWLSNSPEVLSSLPQNHLHPQSLNFASTATQKVLGVTWEPHEDNFNFFIRPAKVPCTKRNMLSVIARLWDIMGFAAPLIMFAKLLIKELWLIKLDWDDEPPSHIQTQWTRFQSELPLLSNLSLPRHIGVTHGCNAALLGFSDASEMGYGAALYVRVQSEDGVSVRLLCAKSKVAPVQTISLARLELMGVHLMSKLIHVVLKAYDNRFIFNNFFAFCDSTVVLNWINSSPHRLKTFVANRVTKIQECLDVQNIYHISGKENPSDCLSRGLTPAQLISHTLWFNAPPWVHQDISQWPIKPFVCVKSAQELPEYKAVVLSNVLPPSNKENSTLTTLTERISSWSKLLRVFTYVLRFSKRLKTRGSITAEDLNKSENFIVRSVQTAHFSDLLKLLQAGKQPPLSMRKLRPFLFEGVIRVGGRLENSDLTFDHKHPILLPSKHKITDLIIDYVHRTACHAGPQHVISLLRQRYWVLSARRTVRARIHSCIACFRARPKPAQPPVMADLPTCRLKISKPFAHTGVDYGGPLMITLTRRRGIKSQKAYLCAFVCLTTRAVHIEVATDLSTDAFLNAFKRFISRRGPVERIYSDHGTNFVGAKSYLTEIQQFLRSNAFSEDFKTELAKNRISWEMIPPNAPHFGGGWEATIKSFKTHLFRVIGSQILTYEELLTVLCQIEAILNSRPLGILSEDPAEPLPLTPAHFLNTTPLAYLPSPNVEKDKPNLLSRFMLLDGLVRSYWRRWSDEYLHTLQIRQKWNTDVPKVYKGMIVLIMRDNSPPLHWPLGIISETIEGKDGHVRIALVKTKTGTLKRPIVRLCPLPNIY